MVIEPSCSISPVRRWAGTSPPAPRTSVLAPALPQQEHKEQQGRQARQTPYGMQSAPPHEQVLGAIQVLGGGWIEKLLVGWHDHHRRKWDDSDEEPATD